jgi:signal transduction histidine kinase/integral membrane sensor domain MASE1
LLAAVGLALVFLCSFWAGSEEGLWLPALGLGLTLVAWLGQAIVPLLALDVFVARLLAATDQSIAGMARDSLLLAAEAGLSWWLYARLARGTRRPEDPRSAAVFLLLVPGVVAAGMAGLQATLSGWLAEPVEGLWKAVSAFWISRALGILALAPPLLVAVTPLLVRLRLTHPEPSRKVPGGAEPQDWSWGEIIETGGLCLGAGVLAVVLVCQHVQRGLPGWPLWGFSLLLVVWAGVRQGLRGGSLVAGTSATLALGLAILLKVSVADFSPLQGNLLAQCTTALLVGASAGWLRASEARYRQMVGHMPVVLYSARLPRGLKGDEAAPSQTAAQPNQPASGSRSGTIRLSGGRLLVLRAEVTLVSPACLAIFNSPPEALLGPYAAWLERIDAADRELVLAALNQLFLQKQPVTCEYRVAVPTAAGQATPAVRWVRDTMVGHYAHEQSSLSGWEGVIEDITEQRLLAQNVRRTNGMLQALVACLPTGVFFVQGPFGQPILVNQRARQLLGKREELSAGINHLTDVYRLHRPDGSPYPVDELPVARALRLGVTSMANDIVVHRADGRRTRLITWAAPVDSSGTGNPDAAVWVLEDFAIMRPALAQEAEAARRQSDRPAPGGSSNEDGAALNRQAAPADKSTRGQSEELERAQRLELVGKLASGAIHDFNNLLTVILGLAGLARGRLPADHPADQDLQRLLEAGDQASQLAAQMLAFSKQTSQQTRPAPRVIDLNALVTHALKLLKGTLPSTIEVTTHLSEGALLVEGDETQLKQVVINLCLNAREAMAKGGVLTVATEKIQAAAAPERGAVRLVVQDSGPGIDPALQERIFEPFFSTKEQGTGLGLAVVRQIVESIGGRIQVVSAPGKGTCMEVLLPASDQKSEIRSQRSEPTSDF